MPAEPAPLPAPPAAGPWAWLDALASPAAAWSPERGVLACNDAMQAILSADPAGSAALVAGVAPAGFSLTRSPLRAPAGAVLLQWAPGASPASDAGLLREVIDSLPINVFLKDPEGRMALANAETARTLGRPRAEVLGKSDSELFAPGVAEAISAVDAKVRAAGPGAAFMHEERLGSAANPRVLLAGKRALPGHDGRLWLLGFSVDITDRRRAELELESQRNFVRQVIDADPNLIFVKDRRNNFRLVNRAVADLFGTTVEAIEGQSNAEVHDNEEEVQGYAEDDLQVIDDGLTIHKEETVTQGDGRVFTYQTTKLPLRFPNGEVMALGISVDITERLRRLDEARRAQTEAEAASRAKTDFLGAVTHEIRTPMNAVIGMSGLLLDSELSPAQRHQAEAIRRSGEALLGLINTIFDFSQIEAGEIRLDVAPFDPRALLAGSLELIAGRARDKGLQVNAIIDNSVPERLVGDAGRIRQIVVNLLQNAVKFTERGEVRAEVNASLAPEGVRLRVEVSDTGVGVPSAELARLFSAFSQADTSASRRFGGLGLGLALSHRLCAHMGGRLGAQSAEGRGSTFWFELPLAVAAPPRAAPAPALGGARCLVVTADPEEGEALAAVLRAWGATPRAPRGVEAGIEALLLSAEGDAPQLVIAGASAASYASALRHARVGPAAGAALLVLVPEGAPPDPEPPAPPERRVPAGDRAAFAAAVEALQPRAQGARAPLALPPARGRRLRVLVAEDNPVNQEVARLLLEGEGHAADVVASGAEAVAALSALPYDLVLLNLQPPTPEGLGPARALRALPEPAGHVDVAVMVAAPSPSLRMACVELGITELLPKPVERARLRGTLRATAARIDAEEQAMAEAQTQADPHQPWTDGPLDDVDEAIFAEVLSQLGAESTGMLLGTLLRDGGARVEQMQARAREEAWRELGNHAHALKSSTGTFGLAQLSARARQIELLCRAGRGPEAAAGVEGLAEALERGVAALRQRLATAP